MTERIMHSEKKTCRTYQTNKKNEQQLMTAALEYAVNYEAAKHSSGRRTMRYSTENRLKTSTNCTRGTEKIYLPIVSQVLNLYFMNFNRPNMAYIESDNEKNCNKSIFSSATLCLNKMHQIWQTAASTNTD